MLSQIQICENGLNDIAGLLWYLNIYIFFYNDIKRFGQNWLPFLAKELYRLSMPLKLELSLNVLFDNSASILHAFSAAGQTAFLFPTKFLPYVVSK